jgi:hypothetical protein
MQGITRAVAGRDMGTVTPKADILPVTAAVETTTLSSNNHHTIDTMGDPLHKTGSSHHSRRNMAEKA